MTMTFSFPAPRPLAKEVAKAPCHKFRVLLALEGDCLATLAVAALVSRCVKLTDRLDILLVNPSKEPTSLLWRLLLCLEQAGIDYRLTSTAGDLGEEVLGYLNRFQGITMVFVNRLPFLEQTIGMAMTRLRSMGYHFVSLPEQPAS